MDSPFTPRTLLAVVVAGIAGTIANSVVVASLVEQADVVDLMLSPGRNAVAIAVAAMLPIVFRFVGPVMAVLEALLLLTAVPSVLAKTVFGVGASWGFVFGVNAVYAAVAVAVYVLMTRVSRPS